MENNVQLLTETALRISGVNPADLQVLSVWLAKQKRQHKQEEHNA